MQEQDLRKILHQPYSSENWKNVIEHVFKSVSLLQDPKVIPCSNEDVKSLVQTGSVRLADGKNLAMFEVQVADNVNISRKRVGLRDIVTKYIDQEHNHGVLAIYEQGTDEYRFTFTAKSTEFDEEGDFISKETDNKRYTYILGSNESCKTAAARFSDLASKKKNATISDVQEAFSVEKLSKDFFSEYTEIYKDFVQHITGKRIIKEKKKWEDKKIHEPNEMFNSVFSKDDKIARDFVKLLLGRLVFIQFLQKKRWVGCNKEDDSWSTGSLTFIGDAFEKLENKDNFYREVLIPLFNALNNQENVNDVFEPTDSKVPSLGGELFELNDLSNNVPGFPKKYFKDLFAFFDKYNFTINENDPEDHEVGIDPEMLGSIFENQLEDNKKKGAFYTPKQIVHYMCQESLKEYLKTYLKRQNLWPKEEEKAKSISSAIDNFLSRKEAGAIMDFDHSIAKALYEVKICDPAIGSGAFPMGLLNEIFTSVHILHTASPDIVGDVWGIKSWDASSVKKSIIQNSIYGVDIEKGAVDIARLRFWLSLIIDEKSPHTLPNLDYKIMQGNSLLESFEGIDLSQVANQNQVEVVELEKDLFGNFVNPQLNITQFRTEDAALLESLTQTYFQSKDPVEKNDLRSQIDELVHEHIAYNLELNEVQLNRLINQAGKDGQRSKAEQKKLNYWKTELVTITEKKKLLDEQFGNTENNYFLWHLYFKDVFDKGGFDIVIGNPPYLRVQEISKTQPKNKISYEDKYQVATDAYDLANIFFELAVNISNKYANNCYIFPHKFFNSSSTAVFRDYLLEGTYIDKIVHFGANMIFNAADTYTCITQFSPKQNDGFELVKLDFGLKWQAELPKLQFNKVKYDQLKTASRLYGSNQWIFFNTKFGYKVFDKIYESGVKIKDVFERVFQGIATGKDDLYLFTGHEANGFVRGFFNKSSEEYQIERKILKPFIKGKNVHRYDKFDDNLFVLFPYEINEDNKGIIMDEKLISVNFPNAYKWLKITEAEHRKKDGKSTNDDHWYRYARKQGIDKVEVIKLSSMEICTNHPNVTLNDTSYYHNTKVYSWVKKEEIKEDYEYFLAIANSKLIWWFLKNTGDTLRGDARTFKTNYLNPFPLPKTVSQKTNNEFKAKVKHILSEKKQNRTTEELEKKIDVMVFKLYNLTYEEALEVDREFWLSRDEYKSFKLS